MATALTKTNHQLGHRLPSWVMAAIDFGDPNEYWRAEDQRVTPEQRAQLPIALDRAEQALTGFDRQTLPRLRELLKPIGAKISPTMSQEQAAAWMSGLLTALSDVPYDLLDSGIRAAVHVPMRFLSEVEGVIRDVIEPEFRSRRIVCQRLRQLASIRDEQTYEAAPAQSEISPENYEEWNELMKTVGAKTRYREDGSVYMDATPAEVRETRGPPKMPGAADIEQIKREMGLA